MDGSKIEVGDVSTHKAEPSVELTAMAISASGKADPYHGITLPAPPAGCRLAKWGEEFGQEAFWFDGGYWVKWRFESDGVTWRDPGHCIFAIPLDQPPPLKSWQFREVPWMVPEPKTLADVPENVDVVSHDDKGGWHVVYRAGGRAYCAGSSAFFSEAKNAKFVRYLDPHPQKPLSLDDVPDGRVVLSSGSRFWRSNGAWYQLLQNGCIRLSDPEDASPWTVTNYIAELRGPA